MAELSNFTIKTFSDSNFSSEVAELKPPVNPSEIRILTNHHVSYSKKDAKATGDTFLHSQDVDPKILSFTLVYDKSGIFGESDMDIQQEMEQVRLNLFEWQSDLNEPYFLRVIWGNLDFKGKLIDLVTSYTKFQAVGPPIRAEVDISILEIT